jgi:anti-anti-sigma factor
VITYYTEEYPVVTILHMTGSMTRDCLKETDAIWDEQLRKKPPVLALNLKGVVSIDSITLNHLFNLTREASRQEVKLIICDASEELNKLFEIVKLERAVLVLTREKFHEKYLRPN